MARNVVLAEIHTTRQLDIEFLGVSGGRFVVTFAGSFGDMPTNTKKVLLMHAFDGRKNMKRHIKFLLDYCQDKPELYNKVANELWVQFGLRSAEVNLLCTYIADRMKGEKNDN